MATSERLIATSFLCIVVILEAFNAVTRLVVNHSGTGGRISYYYAFFAALLHQLFVGLVVPASLLWAAAALHGGEEVEPVLTAVVATLWYGPDRVQAALAALASTRARWRLLRAALAPYHRFQHVNRLRPARIRATADSSVGTDGGRTPLVTLRAAASTAGDAVPPVAAPTAATGSTHAGSLSARAVSSTADDATTGSAGASVLTSEAASPAVPPRAAASTSEVALPAVAPPAVASTPDVAAPPPTAQAAAQGGPRDSQSMERSGVGSPDMSQPGSAHGTPQTPPRSPPLFVTSGWDGRFVPGRVPVRRRLPFLPTVLASRLHIGHDNRIHSGHIHTLGVTNCGRNDRVVDAVYLRSVARLGVALAVDGAFSENNLRDWCIKMVADQARFPMSPLERVDPEHFSVANHHGLGATRMKAAVREVREEWTDKEWAKLIAVYDKIRVQGLHALKAGGWT